MKKLCFKFQKNRTTYKEFDFIEGGGRVHHFQILIIIGIRIKMLCFKLQQNHTITEEFDFFECGGEKGTLIFKFQLELLLVNI